MASVELKHTDAPTIPEVEDRTTENNGASHDLKTSETNRRPRRKPSRFRKIPRSLADDKENKGPRIAKGGRQRTTSVSSATSGRSQRRGAKPARRRTPSEASTISEANEASPLRKLRDTVMDKFQKKGLNLLNSYIKNRMELAKFDNTTNFLERCDVLQVVPNKYRLSNPHIKNTKHVIRTLDRFSFKLMFADLKYNRKRRFQVSKLLSEKEERMRTMFGDDLVTEILKVSNEAFERRFNRIREQQTKIFESLLKEYGIAEDERAESEERLNRIKERERTRQEKRVQEKLRVGDKEGKNEEDDKETKDARGDIIKKDANKEDPETKSSSAVQSADNASNSEDIKRKDVGQGE